MPKRKNKGGRNRERDTDRKLEDVSNEDNMDIESVTVDPLEEREPEKRSASLAEVETALKYEEEIQRLQSKIKELEAQVDKEKKEQLYIRAEFDTYRRRAIKERSDSLKYAGERLFGSLLGVLDNFERALQVEVTPDTLESFRNGVRLIADEMRALLKREGVEEVTPQDGHFDPNIFEAISSEETDEKEPGLITQIFRKAYKLHDRIIRAGQVAVARSPAKSKEASEDTAAEDGWDLEEQ